MIEKIINHPIMTKILQYTATSHLICLGIKLIFLSALPVWVLLMLSGYRQISMLILVAILVLTGVCTLIQTRYASPNHFVAKDSAIIAITILLTSLIFLDGQIEEETIVYFAQELPFTTWHAKLLLDCIFGAFLGKEIYKIFIYSNYSLEPDYAERKIKQHACAFFVKLLFILGIFVASTHTFNLDKLSAHLAKYIIHIFDVALVCAITSIVVVWVAHANSLLKNIFSRK